MARKPFRYAVQDVADDGSGRRCYDAYAEGQKWQRPLARFVEKLLRREFPAALLDERHQSADPSWLQRIDDDLIGGLAGIGCNFSGRDDFQALLRLGLQPRQGSLPDHRIDAGGLVLQAEIGVPGRMRPAIVRNFTAHAHEAKAVLDRPFQGG